MDLVTSLINFLKRKGAADEPEAPAGICPNCWGRDEYGGHFYERVRQENLDVNSTDSNVGWIAAYANKHMNGIALKRTGNGEELICGTCRTSYQHNDEHTNS